ncbi:hypothetical protein D1872_294510 [compost metagenome]
MNENGAGTEKDVPRIPFTNFHERFHAEICIVARFAQHIRKFVGIAHNIVIDGAASVRLYRVFPRTLGGEFFDQGLQCTICG